MENFIDLGKIFDLEQWEEVQDSLADITEMAIIMVDYKGRPKTKHSGSSSFCRKVREDEELSQYCEKCDARGGVEAVRTNKPYIYKCYFSIIDVAIPIIIKGQYIGAIMAGQVRLADEDEKSMEQIYIPANKKHVTERRMQLSKEYEKIPKLSYERICIIAKMFYYLCDYMVLEFIEKNKMIKMYEDICKTKGIPYENQVKQAKHTGPADDKDDDNVLIKYMNLSNPIILNALNYISERRNESPSLEKMAQHCNVSTGHLSRLFTKEAGESYSSFTSRLKIEWAKAILETTDKSIYEISEELGFNDSGYFIKIFKKYVGLTPAVYRSHVKNR